MVVSYPKQRKEKEKELALYKMTVAEPPLQNTVLKSVLEKSSRSISSNAKPEHQKQGVLFLVV